MMDYVTRFSSYVQDGAMHSVGGVPIGQGFRGPVGGTNHWNMMGSHMQLMPGQASFGKMARMGGAAGLMAGGLAYATDGDVGSAAVGGAFLGSMLAGKGKAFGTKDMPGEKNWSRFMGPAAAIGMSGYFAYTGYQENGMQGLRDAVIFDVAMNAAVSKFGYRTINPESSLGLNVGAKISKGFIGQGVRMLGAGVGAQVGMAIGDSIGIPGGSIAGAFAGAYVGAAPLRFAASHPIIAAGAVVAGGLAATGYGAYEVMKMGYAQKQSRKGIQTSGDLAAFMTSGAQTMRGRAVQAIQKSHLNARSALGQEANFLSYPGRNYHSPYRM